VRYEFKTGWEAERNAGKEQEEIPNVFETSGPPKTVE